MQTIKIQYFEASYCYADTTINNDACVLDLQDIESIVKRELQKAEEYRKSNDGYWCEILVTYPDNKVERRTYTLLNLLSQ